MQKQEVQSILLPKQLLKNVYICHDSLSFSSSQVDQAIALCSEMHNIKEAIYENKSKLEGIGEDYQIQVSNDIDFWSL